MIRSISVIVPAFNEETRLPQTLERISSYLHDLPLDFAELIVVDDGSTDRTAQIAREYAALHPCVRVLVNESNRGKGFSVRRGMLSAHGDWRLLTDADLSAPIQEFATLEDAAEEYAADIVIGSRALRRELIGVHQPAFRETAGKFFNLVMRMIIGLRFADTQCGFKLFSSEAAEEAFSRQQLESFGFDVEVLFLAQRLGFRIREIPVRWSHVEGTRVSLWSGARSFLELLIIRRNQLLGRYR